ncbi:type I-E CRISPR-associated protein Cse1/CasA [Streptomyces sp. NPDC001027]|uniref:type I-E CRISPR-associated protein Cse1/CasA n=1 Tax=Streptomyces sp. NPDC001027 TaxID=3154771 RepID=UPI00332682F4
MPSPPGHPAYPVDLRPCIPVQWDGRHRRLGLRELLVEAHRITDLAVPLPPAHSALLRMLTAITAELTGLDDPDLSLEAWHERRTELLTRGQGLPAEAVHAYCDTSHWDLYDQSHPLLQDPRLAEQCTNTSGINKLVFGRPAGNNLAWLSVHTDTAPRPLPSDEAFWHLLIQHSYGAAGRCTTRSAGPHTSGRATAGPLRSTLSFHPQGATLLETLLLHQFPYRGTPQHPDTCPWQEPAPPDPVHLPPPVTWPKRLLTGRSRHAVLLIPNDDGSAATDAYLTWATQHPAYPATDPYLIIDTRPRAGAEQRDRPRRADADRALWRDLDALLLAGDENSTQRRPAVFDSLNDLPDPVRGRVRVRVCGFDQDGRTTNSIWYTALTPPIWNRAEEHDPPAARRIASCRQAAEHLAALLRTRANTAWNETSTPAAAGGSPPAPRRGQPTSRWARQALAWYWPHAEKVFWDLVHHDADEASDPYPAFARTAVAALRQAVRPDLARHRMAGPALARAVRALRAAAAPTAAREKAVRHAQP